MKFYVLRDTVQGIGDTVIRFNVRNVTWTNYEGLDTTEMQVYDADGVEMQDSPLSFTWDSDNSRYVVGSKIDNLLSYLIENNTFKLPLTLQSSQGKNQIEEGVYRIKFYFEDEYGTITELGDRYIDIQTNWQQQDNIPVDSVTKMITDVETSTLKLGEEVNISIIPRYVDVQTYASEIQIVMTPDEISLEQGVVRKISSQNPLHELLVHGLEDKNDVKYEYDSDTETWTLTCVDQTDHETEIGSMTEIDPEYLIGSVQSQSIGQDDSEIIISTIERSDQSNDYTVEVKEGTGDDQQLSAQLLGNQLTVTLGTDPETTQSASIGSGDDGTVNIETIGTGEQMNDYTVEVKEGTGNDQQLSAQLLQNQITVTLGTDGQGQLDPQKNTQSLIQQQIEQIEVEEQQVFTQSASGTGEPPILQQEGPTSFTGGTEDIQSPTKNTQSLIQQQIEQIEVEEQQVFIQEQQGEDPILQQEGPTSFTGGIDFHPNLDEEECQIISGQVDEGFSLYSTSDYLNYVIVKLDTEGKFILETLDPDLSLSKTILETFETSGYAQAYNQLLPILKQETPVYQIQGNILFEVKEKGLSDIVIYDTNSYSEDLRQQIAYIAKRNPGIFAITEDDPPSYPELPYDNTTSELEQTTVQQAIDELKQIIDSLE